VLPDFLIGAQAEAMGAPLLTANRGDFVKYFSEVVLISPPPPSGLYSYKAYARAIPIQPQRLS
jgi:hypothetical protein